MKADYNRILQGYIRRYRDLDDRGREYYFTVVYGHEGSHHFRKLADHTQGDTGAALLEKVAEEARNYGADFITIREYANTSPDAAVVNGKGERIYLSAAGLTEETPEKLTAQDIIRRTHDKMDEQFEGFGGFDGYMNTQRTLMKNDYQIMVLENENQKLERENERLETSKQKLEKENDELLDKCEELLGTVKELKKYAPENLKLLGVNPIPIGAAILERSIKNMAMKNPDTIMKLTGLTKEELSGFLDDGEQTADHTSRQQSAVVQPSHTVQQAPPLTEAQQAHLQVAAAIFEWVKSLKTGDLKKVHEVFSYFYKGESELHTDRIDKLIAFINQKPTTDE